MWGAEMNFLLAGVLTGIFINVVFMWVKRKMEKRGVDKVKESQEIIMENQEKKESAGEIVECEWDRLEKEFKEEGERIEREVRKKREDY
jgi:hypothetical protein